MSRTRPILAACLVLVVFTTGGVGIGGGRVICIGAGGHVAVAGTHEGPEKHECCSHSESESHEGPATLGSTSDCTDWSLDAQHAQRAADGLDAAQLHDFAPIAPHLLTGGQHFCLPDIDPSSLFETANARIPRAHLAPLATTVLLI